MRTKDLLTFALVTSLGVSCAPQVKNIDKQDILGKLSLEDKAHFVIGTGMAGMSGNDAVIGATKSLVPGAAGTTYPLDSLGIPAIVLADGPAGLRIDRKSTRLNSSHANISYAVFCLKKKKKK